MAKNVSIKITDFFNISSVCNYGISFGMMSHLNIGKILILLDFLIIAYLIYLISKENNSFTKASISLIIAGAIANVIDRSIHGCVFDFLDFHLKNYHWPSFNVADTFITIGAINTSMIDIKNKITNKKNNKKKKK